MRVVVVEQDWQAAQHLSRAVERHGCCVLGVAASGADALRYVEGLDPDLVVLNVDVGGPLGAFEVAVACRAIGHAAFLFLTTPATGTDTIARLQAIPAATCLVTPIDNAQLGTALRGIAEAFSAAPVSAVRATSFAQLFAATADSLLIVGPDGRIERVNAEFERRFGYAAAAVVGRSVEVLLPEALRDGHEQHRTRYRAHPQVRQMGALKPLMARAADGSEFPVDISLTPIGSGTDARVLAIVRDTSVQRRLEQAERDRQALEEQLGRVLRLETVGRLAGGIAHDFNNLLTVIGGYTDILLTQACDPVKTRRSLEGIRSTTNRAAELTRQLLAFGRRQMLQPKVIDVAARLDTMRSLLGRVLGEKIEVVVEVEAGVGPVSVDASQLEQVLLNLALNARDAMPNGGTITIEVNQMHVLDDMLLPSSAVAVVPAGLYVRLAVRDFGHGMEPAIMARAFEPFFTTKDVGRGIGMGLPSVYGIVKQSGGFVWIESEPGRGTAVFLLLPVAAGPVDQDYALPADVSTVSSGTILLVEDEPDVRALLVETLCAIGFDVIDAPNGMAALDIFRDVGQRVDVLVSDVVMPHCGGAELVHAARGLRPGLPAVLMSGYANDDQGTGIRPDAITRFIQKPFPADALQRSIAELLDARNLSTSALANY